MVIVGLEISAKMIDKVDIVKSSIFLLFIYRIFAI